MPMSAGDRTTNSLEPILLRSSTPAPSEKVLLFLQGIENSGGYANVGEDGRPLSMFSHHTISDRPPPPNPKDWDPTDPKMTRLPNPIEAFGRRESNQTAKEIEDLNKSKLSYHDENGGVGAGTGAHAADVRSDIQEGQLSEAARSEVGGSVGMHDTGAPHFHEREPGPEDGPGPKYESYGSSFGNLGPLPNDTFAPAGWTQPWHGVAQPTPSRAAGIPLPGEPMFSPKSGSYNINIEGPTDGARSAGGYSRDGSRHSHRSATPVENKQPGGITVTVGLNGTTIHVPQSPKPNSRAPTERVASPKADDMRPWSPMSGHSRSPTNKSGAAPAGYARSRGGGAPSDMQSPGTRYPPLPSSRGAESPPRTSSMSPENNYRDHPASRANSNVNPRSPPRSPIKSVSPMDDAFNGRNIHTILEGASSAKEPSNRGGGASEKDAARSQRGPSTAKGSEANGSQHGGSASHNDVQRSRAASPLASHRSYRTEDSHPHRTNPHKTPTSPQGRVLSPTHSHAHSRHSRTNGNGKAPRDPDATPTQSRAQSPTEELDDQETEIVRGVLTRTPRTSYGPSTLQDELQKTHFHDMDLCILLHAADDEGQHDIVRKAMRKAVKARIKKLGMKHDSESIKQYRKSYHDHDPSWHNRNPPSLTINPEVPPTWAKGMMEQLSAVEQRVAALAPKIDSIKSTSSQGARTTSHRQKSSRRDPGTVTDGDEFSERTPQNTLPPIPTQMTGDESMYRQPDTEYTHPGASTMGPTIPGSAHHNDGSTHGPIDDEDEFADENETQMPNGRTYTNRTPPTQDGDGPRDRARYRRDVMSPDRGDSPGQQFLEEEIYKLRVREPSQSAVTHRSWEIAREDGDGEGDGDGEEHHASGSESELPEIVENGGTAFEDDRKSSPPLPPLPEETRDMVHAPSTQHEAWQPDGWNQDPPPPPPWQRIHQRLLNWAIVWPKTELEVALNSTLRGNQVDEVALSIWSTQQYKRYVRQQLTEAPQARVDRLFVPPNMADAINNAVFHGRHGDACGMLRDLWAPFGLEGMPRIIIVLCKHRSDPSHWVAHKFSLPDGTLSTYDTYPEKCLPDGRPLGWWFAIRIAWPGAMYPSPDHLVQKMVRMHRPMQLPIDNSVAAAGIWRNLLMSSRAERPVDLERLRDLINTEVRNLLQRKEQGKLSISAPRPNWEELAM